jgi:hypothetical protein
VTRLCNLLVRMEMRVVVRRFSPVLRHGERGGGGG